MTICNITGYACDCQPDEGVPCDGLRKLREACESWKKQSIERGRQIETIRNDLTACQLERDASRRAQMTAEEETARALAAHALDVRRLQNEIQELTCGDPRKICPNCRDSAQPQPCTHDDPSWCDAECERWREWVKARRSSEPQGGDHGSND